MLKIQLRITGINHILKHIQTENTYIIFIIFHNKTAFLFNCIFNQINATLQQKKHLFLILVY